LKTRSKRLQLHFLISTIFFLAGIILAQNKEFVAFVMSNPTLFYFLIFIFNILFMIYVWRGEK